MFDECDEAGAVGINQGKYLPQNELYIEVKGPRK